jgi:thymidylate synthase (FAD)
MYFSYQYHEIKRITEQPLDLIEEAYRICYQSESKKETQKEFIANKIKLGHLTPLEHGSMTVYFKTNRGVTHEFVRHRIISPNQASTRYCKYKDGLEFIIPVWAYRKIKQGEFFSYRSEDKLVDQKIKEAYEYEHANANYDWVTNNYVTDYIDLMTRIEHIHLKYSSDVPAQHARGKLPNDLKTQILVTTNFREWRHIFNLRVLGTTGAPHPEIRALLRPLLNEVKQKVPVIFDDLCI